MIVYDEYFPESHPFLRFRVPRKDSAVPLTHEELEAAWLEHEEARKEYDREK